MDMNTYEDFALRDAIMATIMATITGTNHGAAQEAAPIRKALGLSVHQGVERRGELGATYYTPMCGADAERAQFSDNRYRKVDQLLTCSKCIELCND